MRRSWAAVTVGTLAVVTFVTGFLIFRYVKEGVAGEDTLRVYALFTDALGLYERSRVLSAGLEVGKIVCVLLQQLLRLCAKLLLPTLKNTRERLCRTN